MFARTKKSGRYEYLQVVHNERIDGKVRQRVVATLGRLDELQASGQLGRLLASLGRFEEQTAVLTAHRRGELPEARAIRIGPGLVFGRLWEELGIRTELEKLLRRRHFEFPVERAVFLTVLHRLMDPGSDRACEEWRKRYRIPGTEELGLHHLYRAMAWLGEVLPEADQAGATPFAPRTTKDVVEEALFARNRDLFSALDLVFFDTTSIYFEGRGGESIGRYGKSKDKRPDRKQMIVGAVVDRDGRPFSSELWPGNTTDVSTLLPVLDRLQSRFGVGELSIVADQGMISRETVGKLKARRGIRHILGARMRVVKEVHETVLSRPGRYRIVRGPRETSTDPAPLKVKEVWVEDRRYILCLNEEEAARDRTGREEMLANLEEQLARGDKSLVGNKGYRRLLKAPEGDGFQIDWEKVGREARYDGKWVLTTDLDDLDAAEVALRYKELWQVEDLFRNLKSVLQTRPIYHQSEAAIRGHVFCSFLALVLLSELQRRMAERGWRAEWKRLRNDLDALEEIYVEGDGRPFVIRTRTEGQAGKAIQAAGVALGPTVRFVEAPDVEEAHR